MLENSTKNSEVAHLLLSNSFSQAVVSIRCFDGNQPCGTAQLRLYGICPINNSVNNTVVAKFSN